MDKKFKSILSELTDYAPIRDRDLFIESRASQVIGSVANLVRLIEESYTEEESVDLTRRLFHAIKSNDADKFGRKLKKIQETKRNKEDN